MSLSNEVYTRLLLPQGHGFPLSCPEPPDDFPIQYRDRGVGIGDIGIITSDGAFEFLFSICLPIDHIINRNRILPDGFEDVWRWIQVVNDVDFHLPGTVISGSGVLATKVNSSSPDNPADIELSVDSKTSEGAILLLPEGGSRENLLNEKIFVDQALKHGTSWYDCASRARQQDIKNGSLFLVTGCDKATAWGIASFSDNSDRHVSLKLTARSMVAGSPPYKWEADYPTLTRCGPVSPAVQKEKEKERDSSERKPARKQNQCVFIRGLRISRLPATFMPFKSRVKLSLPGIVPDVHARSPIPWVSVPESQPRDVDKDKEISDKAGVGIEEQDRAAARVEGEGSGGDIPKAGESGNIEERQAGPLRLIRPFNKALVSWFMNRRAAAEKREKLPGGVPPVVEDGGTS